MRTWTPGPWSIEHVDSGWTRTGMVKANDYQLANVYTCEDSRGCRDCALIALAPDMAEAILDFDSLDVRWQDWPELYALIDLAKKLREIGSE